MAIESYVKEELKLIHRTRNRIGYFPSVLSLVVSIYFQREALVIDPRWWAAIVFVVVGTLLRIYVNDVFFENLSKKANWVNVLNFLAFIFLGTGWGLHFSDVVYHYGPDSNHVSYVLLIIIAFITGSSTTLLADKLSFFTFISTLGAGVIVTYISLVQWSNAYIILNVILFLAFSISHYKLAHKQLLELLESQIKAQLEKDRLNGIINTVPGFVGLADKEMKVYMANQASLSIYPDIIGRKIGTVDPGSTWEKFLIEFMNSGKSVDVEEHTTLIGNEEISAILNVQRLPDGGLIIVSIITTELKQAQKKIREQEAKAYYSAKLASLGQMAAGIAHEVNNPLTIIQGSANIISRLVESDPIDVPNVKLLAGKMIDTSNRIAKTIKSLKSLSRDGEKDPMTRVSLKEMIDICVELTSQKIRNAGVELRISEIPSLSVLGREVQLSQVMVNLLGNGIDAVKDMINPWIKIDVKQEGDFVLLDVIDCGAGIPKEIQKKMMEPFFTTKEVNHGTGLGLSISKNIIQEFHGELLYLEGAPNTTFRIKLPVAQEC